MVIEFRQPSPRTVRQSIWSQPVGCSLLASQFYRGKACDHREERDRGEAGIETVYARGFEFRCNRDRQRADQKVLGPDLEREDGNRCALEYGRPRSMDSIGHSSSRCCALELDAGDVLRFLRNDRG